MENINALTLFLTSFKLKSQCLRYEKKFNISIILTLVLNMR